MYLLPKYKFVGNGSHVSDHISEGDSRWKHWTSGKIYEYFNTDCFWWDLDCGHYTDDCIAAEV